VAGAGAALRQTGIAGGSATAGNTAAQLGAPVVTSYRPPSATPSPTATPAPSASPAGTAPAPVPAPVPTRSLGRVERMENDVTALVNAERAKAGCGPVHTDERLRTAARRHSADMATQDYFSHTGQDGSSPWDRIRRAGYPSGIGENIAYGYPSAADVMRGWMNSAGHRANILNCDAHAIGVGLAYNSGGTAYWTQDFGSV
jgi:uncharacterized protein YkwD